MKSLLSLLPILDIGRGGVPTRDASFFVQHRIKAGQKPPVLPVFSPQPRLDLVGDSTREFARLFARQAFRVLWMNQPAQITGLPLLKSHAVIIERSPIVIQA